MTVFTDTLVVVVGVLGIASNTMWIAYFMYRQGTLLKGDKLLLILSTLDLSVCVSAGVKVILNSRYHDNEAVTVTLVAATFLFRMSLEWTAFATCVLSVVRMIGTCWPFYKPQLSRIYLSNGVFGGYLLIREGLCARDFYNKYTQNIRPGMSSPLNISNYLKTVTLLILVVIVGASCVVTTVQLLKRRRGGQGDQEGRCAAVRRATITILIISLMFCAFNGILFVVFWLKFFEGMKLNGMVQIIAQWIAVPLNSALNPCVYLVRNQEIKKQSTDRVRKMLRKPVKRPT
eukprot:sb/3467709/